MKQRLLFFLVLLTLVRGYAQPGPPAGPGEGDISFRRFSPENEILQSTVNCAYQDPRGFLWFGTWAGLYRYDGLQLRAFKPQKNDPHGLGGRKIRTIYGDRAGRMWVGTMDDGLYLYDRAHERFVPCKPAPGDPSQPGSSDVTALAEDRDGRLWVGTPEGIHRVEWPATSSGKTSSPAAAAEAPAPRLIRYPISGDTVRQINVIYPDPAGRLWVGTETGLFLFRPGSLSPFTRIPIRAGAPDFYPCNYVAAITGRTDPRTGQTVLWLGTRGGLGKMTLPAGPAGALPKPQWAHYRHREAPFALSNNQVRAVFRMPGADGWLWVGTEDGLNRFDPEREEFHTYRADYADPHRLSSNSIIAFLADRSGVLWVATEKGLNTFDPYQQKFGLYRATVEGAGGLLNNGITALAAGPAATVWVGTGGGGLHRLTFDAAAGRPGRMEHFPLAGTETNPAASHVYALCAARDGSLWVGTNGEGIYRFRPDALRDGDRNVRRYTQYKQNYADTHGLTDNYVLTLYEDRRGTLWAGTWHGDLHTFDPARNRFVPLRGRPGIPAALSQFPITALREDHRGALWVGTRGGGLFRLAAAGDGFRVAHFSTRARDGRRSLGSNFINCLFEDRSGNLWIGTEDGLDRRDGQTGTFTSLDESNGLPDNVIQGILQDGRGLLWLSTTKGIAQLDPAAGGQPDHAGRFFRHFGREDGLQGDVFNANAGVRTPRGLLLFGGINGLNACLPAAVGRNPHPPPVALTRLSVFNQPVPVGKNGAGREILRQSVSETPAVTLTHAENSVSLQFAALHFASPGRNAYAYRLEGFDRDWTYVRAPANVAHYTNLDPGTYTFRVRAANNDGVWNNRGASLTLVIRPPFWATGPAYLLYAAAGIAALYALRRWVLLRAGFRHRLALERVKRENAEALHQLKLRFFTDISHEIRTPLTLITGIVDKVLHGPEHPPRLHGQLLVMQKNSHQLLRLINQLLDFRKHESGYLALQAAEGDLVPFLEGACGSFRELALERRITYRFAPEPASLRAWYDADKLEKIVTNLLSNAFKFTPDGGDIGVSLERVAAGEPLPFAAADRVTAREGWACITVRDSGAGIAPEQLDRIFDVYYQAAEPPNPAATGTGIGLALSKSLAELHHGGIAVTSTAGAGAAFSVFIPLGKAHLAAAELAPGPPPAEPYGPAADLPVLVPAAGEPEAPPAEVPADAPLLLVVEDQADLRTFIGGLFAGTYRVLLAADGAEGLDLAVAQVPDLIISDVLMPRLNGIELCRRLKTDPRTSHIPLLLLTARTDPAHEAEGLETGADDYIGKPFGVQALVLKVRNLLALRENIRRRAGGKKFLSPREVATNPVDEAFLERVLEIVQQHLPDPDFKVEDFTRAIGMSRIQLYRKLKALTGVSVNEFVRNQRLQRAAQLLEKNELTVAEVTYQVGFADLKYFRTCFREHFGVNPSEYAHQKTDLSQE